MNRLPNAYFFENIPHVMGMDKSVVAETAPGALAKRKARRSSAGACTVGDRVVCSTGLNRSSYPDEQKWNYSRTQ
jgi:hypothetical protein